ncbi:hypothetical protein Ato02nite_096050 [Paractinoplanes toevensis]|uniref:Uncharacterized protein n=1 Tax=Paractinoplanes toevensis TaxID=571911 RepID=A0A920BQT4_9ACTN|nr:hypothetical protein Ato02nite_096050 [Actinoplanes toevensis]
MKEMITTRLEPKDKLDIAVTSGVVVNGPEDVLDWHAIDWGEPPLRPTSKSAPGLLVRSGKPSEAGGDR